MIPNTRADGPCPDEPRTVPDAQRWLRHNGIRECTEEQARGLLQIRQSVRRQQRSVLDEEYGGGM